MQPILAVNYPIRDQPHEKPSRMSAHARFVLPKLLEGGAWATKVLVPDESFDKCNLITSHLLALLAKKASRRGFEAMSPSTKREQFGK